MDSVLVLIAAPGSRAIGEDIVQFARHLTGGEPRWLSREEAVEFHISPSSSSRRKPGPNTPREDPPNSCQNLTGLSWVPAFAGMTELRKRMANLPVDIAAVPSASRRKKLLIADMDSTMIGQECIDELGALAGFGEEIAAITARAMQGELDFEGALIERVGLMRGLASDVISRVIRERISLMPGARTLVATMKAHGAHAALVSGGFLQFTAHVAEALGFDEHRANDLIIVDGMLAGTVRRPILGKDAKVAALREISARLGIGLDETLAVGDGANDIPMLQAAGLGVALHAKPKTREAAPVAIDHSDLTALLYLQGYSRGEFIE